MDSAGERFRSSMIQSAVLELVRRQHAKLVEDSGYAEAIEADEPFGYEVTIMTRGTFMHLNPPPLKLLAIKKRAKRIKPIQKWYDKLLKRIYHYNPGLQLV